MPAETVATGTSSLDGDGKKAIRKSALRKNAWRLMPVLIFAFIINFIDRNSVGFAALTMNEDLGLTAQQYGWGAGILFAGYCFLEIPSNLALYRYGARHWLTRIMVTWGLAEAATALVQGPASFYLMRFLLGVAEAGFFPGVTFFLARWFPIKERVRVQALFALGIPLSAILGAPLSTFLLRCDGLFGLHGWQLLFLVEGLLAVLAGLVVFVVLRDEPKDAFWLTPDERSELIETLAEGSGEKSEGNLIAALKDHRVLMLAAIQFGFVLGGYGINMWLPLMLKSRGLGLLEIGRLAVVPYISAMFVLLIWSRIINRFGRPVTNLAIACLLGCTGLAISAHADSVAVEMLGITMASSASVSAVGILWTIPTRFLTGSAAAGGLAFINSVGTLGGFFGPYLVGVLRQTTGTFTAGIWAMSGILAVSAGIAAVLASLVKSR